jgi:putative nucleotidyltransferase with HDIG domain
MTTGRPSRAVIAAEFAALAAALVVCVLRLPWANWDVGLLATLLALSIVSDLFRIDSPVHTLAVSASFLTIVTAAVFLGAVPAAVIGMLTIIATWIKERYVLTTLLINLATYAWFPLVAGILFHEVSGSAGIAEGSGAFYLLIFGVFVVALAIDFTVIAGYFCYVERSSFATKVRRALLPLLPSELASAMLALVVAFAYLQIGTEAVALFGILIIVFQYLVGALVVSQERADELELRARQLAGFQVALLSALLRTLDLRDHMTARHSAAVARYSREIAAKAGLSQAEQELVHSAGLLHDIGKFVLPDDILKSSRRTLSEADWEQIKTHPLEGSKIVSQIDGYAPIGDIILAHHERIDGEGYPRGLAGEEIPKLARIIAVADTYDVMTSRDSYRDPVSSQEAIFELRRVSGTQLDGRFVEVFIEVLKDKDIAYRQGRDVDFETELALDRRIHDYAAATPLASTTDESTAQSTG